MTGNDNLPGLYTAQYAGSASLQWAHTPTARQYQGSVTTALPPRAKSSMRRGLYPRLSRRELSLWHKAKHRRR